MQKIKINKNFSYLKPIKSFLNVSIKNLDQKNQACSIVSIKKSWNNIVGNELAQKCTPSKLNSLNKDNNTLTLKVPRQFLIDVDYSRDEIINKVNSFFGFNLVQKIIVNPFETSKNNLNDKKKLNATKNIKDKLEQISDEELKKKLSNFF